LREAVRTVLDQPHYQFRATQIADEFAEIDTRTEILRVIGELVTDETEVSRLRAIAASQGRRSGRRA
jgi:UDP:flavonoid glycosyltransferase YjiC (YdhE family)